MCFQLIVCIMLIGRETSLPHRYEAAILALPQLLFSSLGTVLAKIFGNHVSDSLTIAIYAAK